MKKLFFLVPVLALALAGCSSDEPGGMPVNGDAETNYLSVSLVSATASRAADDAYEVGTKEENEVKSVRFYFFDAAGEAAAVKYNTTGFNSYYDWTPGADDMLGDKLPNLSEQIKATLVINTKEGDNVPVSVMAVINPTQALKDLGNLSISELNKNVADYNITDGFVMSSAVYADGGVKKEEVLIAGHLAASPEAALANPVTIHVERVLAKVSMNIALEGKKVNYGNEEFEIYPTSTDDKTQSFNGKEIYVRVLGWNVTAKTDESRLVKEINPSWGADLFGTGKENWNDPAKYRSYWAINPEKGVSYSNFNAAENLAANQIAVGDYTYVQENAAKGMTGEDADIHTKVIVAAQLVDETGAPIEFAEWAGNRYSIDDLTTLFANVSNIFKVTTSAEGKTYTKITADDLVLKTAYAAGKAENVENGKRYYVYAQLKDPQSATWALGNGAEEAKAEDVNAALINLGGAKVWEDGYTYYYFEVSHLGSAGKGQYGIVRNHVYKTNVTKIAGLGTPVYDAVEDIYPEKPEDDQYTYIAAQINVLSWRIVEQNVEFDW